MGLGGVLRAISRSVGIDMCDIVAAGAVPIGYVCTAGPPPSEPGTVPIMTTERSADGERSRRRRHEHRPLRRLDQPLVRDGDRLRPASWDEALDRAAAGFRGVLDTIGGGAVGVFSCSKSTNELNFMAQKLARTAFATNNIDSCNRT